jgi:hypothetical protein
MLEYLVAHPEKGLLGYTMGLPVIVQCWRSFDQLEAFARDTTDPHAATWREYYRRQAARAPGSGMRRSWCARVRTRRSTTTCRRSDSAAPVD